MNDTIVLTGGGTAGHVMVNINLQNELKKYFSNIIYIGSKFGIEKKLIKEKTSYKYFEITTVKLERNKVLKNLLIPFKLKKAISEAKKILKEIKPNVIFSKGGYVSLPVVIAGKKLGIPVICHESDITMGLANKLSKKYANVICTNFEITAKENGKKSVCTGMPLPKQTLTKNEIKNKLKIKTNKPILLITGGSLGAESLNKFVFENIEYFTNNFFVIHQVGKNKTNTKIKNKDYLQFEFIDNMWDFYSISDYAISRAGANTIIELLASKILTIFVPLPKSASRGDQIENAKYLKNKNLAEMILQEDLTLEKVQNCFKNLEKNSKKIKNSINSSNFQDGTNKIMKIILNEKTPQKICREN